MRELIEIVPGASLHLIAVSTKSEGLAGPASFAIEIESSARYTIVRVSGDVDLASAPRLRQSLSELGSGVAVVVIDLSGVTFMDSSGLSVLLSMREQLLAPDESTQLRLVISQSALTRLFDVTGLNDIFEIFSTCDQAVGLG